MLLESGWDTSLQAKTAFGLITCILTLEAAALSLLSRVLYKCMLTMNRLLDCEPGACLVALTNYSSVQGLLCRAKK